jgi:hypothetical protein
LRQAEEGLHGRVVPGGADAAHRADDVVSVACVDELPAAELRPAVGVHHTAGHVAAAGDCVVQRGRGSDSPGPQRVSKPPQTEEVPLWHPLTHCEVMLLAVSLTVAPEGARSLTASVGPVGTDPPWMV